nr:hypothetical protein [Thermoanaerobacter siderophilus]
MYFMGAKVVIDKFHFVRFSQSHHP